MDGAKLEQLMLGAGFIDVTIRKLKLEVGTWGPGNPAAGVG
jgi:hypothetical protein